MDDWVGKWDTPKRGPNLTGALYHSLIFARLSDESKAAEKPERMAYQRIIDTVSDDIAAATTTRTQAEVIDEFRRSLPYNLGRNDAVAVITDVFAATLDTLTSEKQTHSPNVVQSNPYTGLIGDWVGKWEAPQRGPLFSAALYRSPRYALLSPESQAAEEPERTAYQRIIDIVADDIAAATANGTQAEVINEFRESLPYNLGKNDAVAVMADVFAATLDILTAQATASLAKQY
jgi:hypothetical protein